MTHKIRQVNFGLGKTIPKGTLVQVELTDGSGIFSVTLCLPGQQSPTVITGLRVEAELLTIPLPISFLSHAKEDREFVADIAERLRIDGVLSWFDESDLHPGDRWEDEIGRAMTHADYIIVFLSSASVAKTGYFQRELKKALDQQDLRPAGQKHIIPVLLEDCEPPSALTEFYWLRTDQAGWYEKLRNAISNLPTRGNRETTYGSINRDNT